VPQTTAEEVRVDARTLPIRLDSIDRRDLREDQAESLELRRHPVESIGRAIKIDDKPARP
jgi:hypothetical protein